MTKKLSGALALSPEAVVKMPVKTAAVTTNRTAIVIRLSKTRLRPKAISQFFHMLRRARRYPPDWHYAQDEKTATDFPPLRFLRTLEMASARLALRLAAG